MGGFKARFYEIEEVVEEAGYYTDGKTLLDVVNSYDARFGLGLSDQEKHDLVEYLKSL